MIWIVSSTFYAMQIFVRAQEEVRTGPRGSAPPRVRTDPFCQFCPNLTRSSRPVFSKSIGSFRHTFFTFTYFLHLQSRDPHRPFRPIYVPRGSHEDPFDRFFTSYWPQIKKCHGNKSVWTRLIHHSRLSTYLICEVYDFPKFPIGSESKCLIYVCTLEWCKRRNTRFCLTLAPDKI